MEDEQKINAAYVDILLQKRDAHLSSAMAEMENINNLNNAPQLVLTAGRRAARRAFALGVQWARQNPQP